MSPAAVKAAKGGAVEFRVEKAGIVHGAASARRRSTPAKLVENIKAFAEYGRPRRSPTGAKGTYLQRIGDLLVDGPSGPRRRSTVLSA